MWKVINQTETIMAIKVDINASIGEIVWECDDKQITLHLYRLHREFKDYATLHGLKQRGSDTYAIPRDQKTGHSATAEEKFAALQNWVSHAESGTSQWELRRAARAAEPNWLALALEALFPGKDIGAFLEGKSKAQKAALVIRADISGKIRELQNSLTSGIDSDSMLAELV